MATPKNTQFDNVCASFLLIAMDCGENVGLGPSAGGHRMPLGIDRRRRTNKLQHTHTHMPGEPRNNAPFVQKIKGPRTTTTTNRSAGVLCASVCRPQPCVCVCVCEPPKFASQPPTCHQPHPPHLGVEKGYGCERKPMQFRSPSVCVGVGRARQQRIQRERERK